MVILGLVAIVLGLISLFFELIKELITYIFVWCPYCNSRDIYKEDDSWWCRACSRKVK